MPTPVSIEYPIPSSWDEFEDLAWEIISRKWNDPGAQRYGRSGQAQQGVDIYGFDRAGDGLFAGVQCKRYEAGRFTRKIIEEEIGKAENFQPPLEKFIFATTNRRDAGIQETARLINQDRKAAGKFPIDIFFWEDLCSQLADPQNRDLLEKFYGSFLIPVPMDHQDEIGVVAVPQSAAPVIQTAVLKGGLGFEEGEALPQREREIQQLYTTIANSAFRFRILSGESGCGKTSLLRAGLVPLLRENKILPVYVPSMVSDPYHAIRTVLRNAKLIKPSIVSTQENLAQSLQNIAAGYKKVVVLLDQFEEFLDFAQKTKVEGFLNWIEQIATDPAIPVVFLVSIRASFLNRLRNLAPGLPDVASPFQLSNFNPQQARQVLEQAAQTDSILFEPDLLQAMLRDLERNREIRPAELQLVATRLKNKNITRLTDYVSPLLMRVFIIIYNPVVDPRTGETLVDRLGFYDPNTLVKEFIADIQECSDQLVHYQIVERNFYVGQVVLNECPLKLNRTQYTGQNYAEIYRTLKFSGGMLDYKNLIEENNLLARISNREFDEVWLVGFPDAGFYESVMAGKGAFFCNGPVISHTEASKRRFMIMGFSYERSTAEMLECLGHRAEQILQTVFRKKRGKDNFFARFSQVDKTSPNNANVGTMHYAPNSQADYDWGNPTPVRSFCDDWYQFPDMTGMVRKVDTEEWGGGDMRLHHKWWFRHLPHAAGATNGVSNNWWRYIIDPNNVG
jgi:hypothetical protein